MKSSFFLSLLSLLFICSRCIATLANQTIDDTDPAVKYDSYKPSDAPLRCGSNTCSTSAQNCDCPSSFETMIAGTMTSVAGEITIPFTGNSVWVFFASMHKIRCAFHIDGEDVGSFQHNATQSGQGSILGYRNTSLPSGSHNLVIISEQGGFTDFDGLIYQKNTIIIGSVVGGSVLLLGVLCAVVVLRRRSRGWRNLAAVEHPFPVDEEKSVSAPVPASSGTRGETTVHAPQSSSQDLVVHSASNESSSSSPMSNLAEHLRRVEARLRGTEALSLLRRLSNGRSILSASSGRSPPPAYSDSGSIS
ncbi:hypothetical protein B0H19DRAFT_1224728 [Mycena capillaripes]|nr:hypothetical protein B0H19DRAFT_1224728 [Mycena capillaripes]